MKTGCFIILLSTLTTIILSYSSYFVLANVVCDNRLEDGCHCDTKNSSHWHSSVKKDIKCCCKGLVIEEVPKNLSLTVKHLYLKHVGLLKIEENDFQAYPDLEEIEILEANFLQHIKAKAFSHLKLLRKLSIKRCPSLRYIDGVLDATNGHMLSLSLTHNALHDLPSIITSKDTLNAPSIDLTYNEIRMIKTKSLEDIEASSLDLSRNKIDVIEDYAFVNAKIHILRLDYNPLSSASNKAFSNVSTLDALSISHSAIRTLPEDGLEKVKKLLLTDCPNLKQLPSIFVFTSLEEAHLTYPYHCCLFKHAEVSQQTSSNIGKYKGNMEEMSKKHCTSEDQNNSENPNLTPSLIPADIPSLAIKKRRKRQQNELEDNSQVTQQTPSWDDFDDEEDNDNKNTWGDFEEGGGNDNELGYTDYIPNSGHHVPSPFPLVKHPSQGHGQWIGEAVTIVSKQIPTFCNSTGQMDFKKYYSKIKCYPEPDPLNPCEDVVGFVWLRGAIWFVWIMAILGNILVIAILLVTRQPRNKVNHFLMMNLSFADFCTGIYMATLAIQDARTAGVYYNYAVDWQTGWGCNAAGFLAVFASELSIFTMVVISFELWYNTKYVFYGGRLKFGVAVLIMASGWVFALATSIMPLLNVFSAYSSTSTCLPLRVTSTGDKVYLITALTINVLAFAYIVVNYVMVYCMVAGTNAPTARTQDMAIAKRMAILIGTNFICWAPTIFFGLTAASSLPLISVSVAKIFLVIFYPINAFCNPFLYVFLTRMFRKDMSSIIRKHSFLKKLSQAWPVRSSGSSARSSLWSNYTSRNNSNAKNASLTATITSWVSNTSVNTTTNNNNMVNGRDDHATHKLSTMSTGSEFNDSEDFVSKSFENQQPRSASVTVGNGGGGIWSKRRRSSAKFMKTRFSETVESFGVNGCHDNIETVPLKPSADQTPPSSPPRKEGMQQAMDNNYWYKKRFSFHKIFTSDKSEGKDKNKALLIATEETKELIET